MTVTGLQPLAKYNVSLKIVPADAQRYKFLNGYWQATGESDVLQDESKMEYVHPSSLTTGEMWCKKPVSFKTVKITHAPGSKNGDVRASIE